MSSDKLEEIPWNEEGCERDEATPLLPGPADKSLNVDKAWNKERTMSLITNVGACH